MELRALFSKHTFVDGCRAWGLKKGSRSQGMEPSMFGLVLGAAKEAASVPRTHYYQATFKLTATTRRLGSPHPVPLDK